MVAEERVVLKKVVSAAAPKARQTARRSLGAAKTMAKEDREERARGLGGRGGLGVIICAWGRS